MGEKKKQIFSWETLLIVERFPIDCRKTKEGKIFNITKSQIHTDVTSSSEKCIWRHSWFYIISDWLREWGKFSKPIHRGKRDKPTQSRATQFLIQLFIFHWNLITTKKEASKIWCSKWGCDWTKEFQKQHSELLFHLFIIMLISTKGRCYCLMYLDRIEQSSFRFLHLFIKLSC